MYDILLAVDDQEDRARAQVEAITALPGAQADIRVLVLHVFEDNPQGGSVGRVVGVREATAYFDDHDVAYDLIESSGDPANEIMQNASERDVDLISVGGRRRSPTGKALFGSVAQQVILNADQPVLTTRVDE